MENFKQKYVEYLIPVLCLLTGIIIGFILSPIKNGKITLFSNNTIGSGNGCGNSAKDMMLGSQKSNAGEE